MPDKYSKIGKTLESLHNQTVKLDAIYLGLPKKSRRMGIDYPPLPDKIKELCTVVEVEDFGPITKLVAGLISEQDPDTLCLTFDDDMVYPKTMVEKLILHHKEYPNSAIGSAGMLLKNPCPMCAVTPNENNWLYRFPKFRIPPEGRRVDSIYGYPGALYIRKFFPSNENLEAEILNFALVDNFVYLNDDVTISGFLSIKGIERRIFAGMPAVDFIYNENGIRERNETEISYNTDKFFQTLNLAIASAKSIGMYQCTEELGSNETIVGLLLVLSFAILIVILLVGYLIWAKQMKIISF